MTGVTSEITAISPWVLASGAAYRRRNQWSLNLKALPALSLGTLTLILTRYLEVCRNCGGTKARPRLCAPPLTPPSIPPGRLPCGARHL